MTTLTASQARARLYKLLDQAASSHEPIQITGKRSNAVLVSEDDWRSIQETLYLLFIAAQEAYLRRIIREEIRNSGAGKSLRPSHLSE